MRHPREEWRHFDHGALGAILRVCSYWFALFGCGALALLLFGAVFNPLAWVFIHPFAIRNATGVDLLVTLSV